MRRNRGIRQRLTAGKGRWVLMAALALCAALAMAIFAQTQPKNGKNTQAAQPARRTATGSARVEIKPAERKPLSYYTSGVRADLFGSPAAQEQPVVKVEQPQPALPQMPEPEVVDPFVDYAYTGTIMMGGQALALVENSKTKEGTYLRQGDQFMGGTVTEVTDRGVTITVAGKARTLAKSEDFRLTPLDKDAPFRTTNPQGMPGMPGGAPGMPGMMPGMPPGGMGMPGMPGMGPMSPDFMQRMQQRFQGMTPEQLQEMRNRFMNRSFEGGQRRRRFF